MTNPETISTSTAPVRHYRVLFWVLALIGLALDLGSKSYVFQWLGPEDAIYQSARSYPIWKPTPTTGFQLVAQYFQNENGEWVPHVNHGALFGMGNDHKSPANGIFLIISLAAALGLMAWSIYGIGIRFAWLTTALGLILGGTLGNLHDRIVFGGVRDFLHWNYLYDWPVFNLADCWLVTGAGMLLVQSFFFPDPQADAKTKTQAVSAQPNPISGPA